MPVFRFDDGRIFEANWSAFMVELEAVDASMAAILAANKDKLIAIVRQGERNSQARSTFNAAIVAALDVLVAQAADEAS
jgi:hypothetical protein